MRARWAVHMFIGGLIPVLAALAGPTAPWWADLMSPFMLHATIALTIAWALAEAPWARAVVGLALFVALTRLFPLFGGKDEGTRALTILELNVNVANPRTDEIRALIEASDADVAVVLELSYPMERALAQLTPPWRTLAYRASSDAFGIGVYSRHAASSTVVRQLGVVFPAIEARLPGAPAILAVHVMPPIDEEATLEHRRQLVELASWVKSSSVVVVGDLNATVWSAGYASLAAAGLRTSAEGFGYGGTWPSALGPFGIPIDHVMLGAGLVALEHEVIDIPGSDHRGLRVVIGRR